MSIINHVESVAKKVGLSGWELYAWGCLTSNGYRVTLRQLVLSTKIYRCM